MRLVARLDSLDICYMIMRLVSRKRGVVPREIAGVETCFFAFQATLVSTERA